MAVDRAQRLKREWEDRERQYGSTKRAVLLKRLPFWVNRYIHARHMRFIKNAIPNNTNTVLDIGCGYGRVSGELKRYMPGLSFTGVEVCTGFAASYERDIGTCFCGAIEDFSSKEPFDFVIVVTLLMYIQESDLADVVKKIWSFVAPGGVFVCIEPAVEMLNLWRRLSSSGSASPTGGDVLHFRKDEMMSLFSSLPGATITKSMSVPIFPFVSATTVHHGFVVRKDA